MSSIIPGELPEFNIHVYILVHLIPTQKYRSAGIKLDKSDMVVHLVNEANVIRRLLDRTYIYANILFKISAFLYVFLFGILFLFSFSPLVVSNLDFNYNH